jgi:hypothetical protein
VDIVRKRQVLTVLIVGLCDMNYNKQMNSAALVGLLVKKSLEFSTDQIIHLKVRNA